MSANNRSDLSVQDFIGGASPSCNVPRACIFRRHLRLFGGALFLALSATLVAQTHFCIGGDIDHMTPANVAACEAKLSGVRNAVRQQGAPAGWHFVVVCDEMGWKEFTSFSHREAGLLSNASYSTDPRLHWIFLRAGQIDVEQPQTVVTAVTMALGKIPTRKSAPEVRVVRSTRQYIAMAQRDPTVTPDPSVTP